MPIIEINGLPDVDIINLLGIMLFPNSKEDRDKHHLIFQLKHDLNKQESHYQVSRYELSLLLDSPSYDDWQIKCQNNTKKALVAGDLLGLAYVMHTFNIPEPSMNKAIFVMKEFANSHDVKYKDGDRLPISEQTIRNCWNEFHTVAHFWATYRLNQDYNINPDSLVFNDNGYIKFLEATAGVLKFGKEFVSFRSKNSRPLLYGDDVWLLPNHIQTRNLNSNWSPDLMIKMLEKYKAPSNSSY